MNIFNIVNCAVICKNLVIRFLDSELQPPLVNATLNDHRFGML